MPVGTAEQAVDRRVCERIDDAGGLAVGDDAGVAAGFGEPDPGAVLRVGAVAIGRRCGWTALRRLIRGTTDADELAGEHAGEPGPTIVPTVSFGEMEAFR
ncbi:hypothetical protein ACFYW8_44265 [Streptomyces sp. NPDC002742]|uniref:hypothetical protein n=1 Tax=unclassified Streptomyces TaxID=2593676 RepID=UPI003421C2CE